MMFLLLIHLPIMYSVEHQRNALLFRLLSQRKYFLLGKYFSCHIFLSWKYFLLSNKYFWKYFLACERPLNSINACSYTSIIDIYEQHYLNLKYFYFRTILKIIDHFFHYLKCQLYLSLSSSYIVTLVSYLAKT